MDSQTLDQAEVWIDKEGVSHRIEDMPGRYALNVYDWLRARHQGIAWRYASSLWTVRLPDPDTAAFDDVSDAIEREQHRISEDSLAWLLDKPLLRALRARIALDRIKRGTEGGPRPQAEFRRNLDRYTCEHGFTVAPSGDLDEVTYGQRPGDETKVFIVMAGDYEDRKPVAVFVGNRLAAYRYEVEHNRYNTYTQAEVTEWDDYHDGRTEGMYGQIRRYRDPWSEVEFRTLVDLETSQVVADHPVEVETVAGRSPEIVTTKEADGRRGAYRASIVTRGPDTELDAVRRQHEHAVNTIRANVLDDITKDMP